MTPQAFIAKWSAGAAADALSERAGAQAHFIDLCRLLDVPEPADPDTYCFERGLKKTGGLHGWADVWKLGCFAWEYKAPGRDLAAALRALKDLEHRANLDAEALGLERQLGIEVSPANVLGIELNPCAAELARVTVWIGEIQWMLKHGYAIRRNPILDTLDHIECRDALLTPDGQQADWPKADVIIGNPPFLGDKKMRAELGDAYTARLRQTYKGRVPGGADLVCFGPHEGPVRLDGREVPLIAPDLTAAGAQTGADLTRAAVLAENRAAAFLGIQKTGPFELPGDLARRWLCQPNPHGRSNAEVVRPWFNGLDITRRPRDMWIVDFGSDMAYEEAMLFEQPFAHVEKHVRPTRVGKREARTNECFWLFQWPRPQMRKAIADLPRFIATPEVAKHRVFTWLPSGVTLDKNLIVIARADDTTFGILHSRFHELWSLRLCTWLGVGNDPRYTPTTTFETFPFPPGLTPADTAHQRTEALEGGARIAAGLPPAVRPHAEAIARAAHRLNALREAWLNPPEWVEWVRTPEEEQAGFPPRPVPKPDFEVQLKTRTLTNLYNQRPAWLVQAHRALDTAVAAAYGWAGDTAEMPDDAILARLLALNQARAAR